MAISILNQTSASLNQASYTMSIPATTAGSTLIICVTTIGGTNNNFNGAVDNGQMFPYYDVATTGTRTDSGVMRQSHIVYRSNVQAGVNTVYIVPVYGDGAHAMNLYATVFEVAGVNYVSPLENANTRVVTTTGNTTSGNAATTAFTNAFFPACAIRTSSAQMGVATNAFSLDFRVNSASTVHAHKIASGSQTLVVDHSFGTQGSVISIAAFNPSANAYTLDLDDSISTDDTLGNAADFVSSLSDSTTLSEMFSASLTTLEHFKTLLDTLVLGVTISFVTSYLRLLQDEVILTDEIAFVNNTFRTLNDTVTMNDWLSIKKISDDWGS